MAQRPVSALLPRMLAALAASMLALAGPATAQTRPPADYANVQLRDPAKEAERPEVYNLLGIYAALSDKSLKDVVAEFAGREFSFFKQVLTDLAVATIGQMGNEMKRLLADRAEIDAVLRDGAERARAIAAPILRDVEDIFGFLRP